MCSLLSTIMPSRFTSKVINIISLILNYICKERLQFLCNSPNNEIQVTWVWILKPWSPDSDTIWGYSRNFQRGMRLEEVGSWSNPQKICASPCVLHPLYHKTISSPSPRGSNDMVGSFFFQTHRARRARSKPSEIVSQNKSIPPLLFMPSITSLQWEK